MSPEISYYPLSNRCRSIQIGQGGDMFHVLARRASDVEEWN